MLVSHAISLVIVIPLAGAFFTEILSKFNKKLLFPLSLLVLLLSSVFVAVLAQQVYAGNYVARAIESDNPTRLSLTTPSGYRIPVRIILTADAMSVLMVVFASLIAVFALVYSLKFVKIKKALFYPLFLLMCAGVYGMALTGDLFNMFVFLEIASISGAGLITTFDCKRAPDSALKFLVVSTVGALMFLVGIGLLYGQYGSLNLAFLATSIKWTLLDKIALGLFVTALAMKAGSVPMHLWVPDAYGNSPSSVTAFLAVMSLTGFYALVRIVFTLFGISFSKIPLNALTVGVIMVLLGVLSMLVGATMALRQNHLKRVIAFLSVAQLGYMLMALGAGLAVLYNPSVVAGNPWKIAFVSLNGGVFHLVNHVIYDALLFLCAGAVYQSAGSLDFKDLHGLAHKMPLTAVAFLVGALAIAGVPPTNGFASKILIYESLFHVNPLLTVLALLASIVTLAAIMKGFYSVFLGPAPSKKAEDPPLSMLFPILLLALLVVLFGLFPEIVLQNIVQPAVNALTNPSSYAGVVLGV
jgi:multicomponent Na+:H+ antiporter subunit D